MAAQRFMSFRDERELHLPLLRRHRRQRQLDDWPVSRHPREAVGAGPRSPEWAVSRSAECVCRRPGWPGNVADAGNLLGRPSSGCTTCPEERSRSGRPYTKLRAKNLKQLNLGIIF